VVAREQGKLINVRMPFVREVVKGGACEASHAPSQLNDADYLTKLLQVESLSRASARFGFVARLDEEMY
jgi:hypothetical protein